MKTLKYIGLSLLSLIAIFVLFGLFQNKEVSVSRSIVINAPMNTVFDQFNDLEKRLQWSPWETLDSTMLPVLGEVTKGSGASYSWTSENQGEGTIKYSEVVENQLIQSELYFGSPEDEPAQGLMIFSSVGDGVKVTWEVHMDMGNNPIMRIVGRYMDEMVGETFELGLNAVKEICENLPSELPPNYDDVNIQLMDIESKPYIGLMDSSSMEEMSEKIEMGFEALASYFQANNLVTDEFIRITYHLYEPPTKIVFEPLFVLASEVSVNDERLYMGTTYGGKVITATHKGPYENSLHVWDAMDHYIEVNGLTVIGSPWEEYENTKKTESDPEKLITHIYMPVN